jgi:hypothetical protein
MSGQSATAKVASGSRKPNPNRGSKPGERRGGRKKGTPNKATASIREAARQYTQDALDTLASVMSDEKQPAAARVSAANALLDRGYGKPAQPVDGDGEGGAIKHIHDLSDAALAAIAAGGL